MLGTLNDNEIGVASVKFGGEDDVSLNSECRREGACTTCMGWDNDASSVLIVDMSDSKFKMLTLL